MSDESHLLHSIMERVSSSEKLDLENEINLLQLAKVNFFFFWFFFL